MTFAPGREAMWFGTSIVVVMAATEVARRLASATGAVARPNPIVRTHRSPVPYLGGTVLIASYVILLGVRYALAGHMPEREVTIRTFCALLFAALGTWDDLLPIRALSKFGSQVLICAGYLLLLGDTPSLGFMLKLLTLLTLVNAFNLIDVMDGLLCLLAGIAICGLLATPALAPGAIRIELTLMLAGLLAVFCFNCPPARIYSGDAGSLSLGFLVGAWCLTVVDHARPATTASLIGLCMIPLIELAILVPARLRRGRSPFHGSPDHFSLRLQEQLGWSKWRVLGVTMLVGAFFALAPSAAGRLEGTSLLAYGVVCSGAVAVLWYGIWRIPPRHLA